MDSSSNRDEREKLTNLWLETADGAAFVKLIARPSSSQSDTKRVSSKRDAISAGAGLHWLDLSVPASKANGIAVLMIRAIMPTVDESGRAFRENRSSDPSVARASEHVAESMRCSSSLTHAKLSSWHKCTGRAIN